jgi:hypothetical protein
MVEMIIRMTSRRGQDHVRGGRNRFGTGIGLDPQDAVVCERVFRRR